MRILSRLALVPALAAVALLGGCGQDRVDAIGSDPLSQQINKARLEYYGKGIVRTQPGETRSEEALMNTARQRALAELSATFDQQIARQTQSVLSSSAGLMGAGVDPKDKEAVSRMNTKLKEVGDTATSTDTTTTSSTAAIAGVAYITGDWDEKGTRTYGAVAYIHSNHLDQYRELVNTKFGMLQTKLKNEAEGLSSDAKVKYEAALKAAQSGMLKDVMDQAAAQAAADKAAYQDQLGKVQGELAAAQAAGNASKAELSGMQREQEKLKEKITAAESAQQKAEAQAAADAKAAKEATEKAAAASDKAGL